MKITFITIVTKNFWPGFAATVESVLQNSKLLLEEYEYNVYCDDRLAPVEWISSRQERILLRPISDLPAIVELAPQQQGARMSQALQKLSIFSINYESNKMIYIDCDMICLSSLRELLSIEPIALASDDFDISDFSVSVPRGELNTGMLIFKPSQQIYEELLNVYQGNPFAFTSKGDQDVFNEWAKRVQVCILNSYWNFSKRHQDKVGYTWIKNNLANIKFLHFVNCKPWYKSKDLRTLAECRYKRLELIWWKYFFASRFSDPIRSCLQFAQILTERIAAPFIKASMIRERLANTKRSVRERIRSFMLRHPLVRNLATGILNKALNLIQYPTVHECARIKSEFEASVLFRDLIVQAGPLAGLKYPKQISHGSAISAKLLGVYEAELHSVIVQVIKSQPKIVIDIGCAEGYYAVGLARLLPMAEIIAFDISAYARSLCAEMVKHNNINNVQIMGEAKAQQLVELAPQGPGFVLCDCEGAEQGLLTAEVFIALRNWIILVEMHEFIHHGIEENLVSIAEKTHTIMVIDSVDDYRRIHKYPSHYTKHLAHDVQFFLYREGRPHMMRWLVAYPHDFKCF